MDESRETQYYVDEVLKKYPILFVLPPPGRLLLLTIAVCLIGGTLALTIVDIHFIFIAFSFGILIALSSLFSELIVHPLLKNDKILDVKRRLGLLLSSSTVYVIIILIGAVLTNLTKISDALFRVSIVGCSSVFAFRLFLMLYISTVSRLRIVLATAAQPGLLLISSAYLGRILGALNFAVYGLIFFISISVLMVMASILMRELDPIGKRLFGVNSTPIIRAFFASWIGGLNTPLENFFEYVGMKDDVKISLLAFKSQNENSNFKALMVVPTIHPGPFKDIGSSLLPSLVQEALGKKFNCPVVVPHGISGHELNLASKTQTLEVVNLLLNSLVFKHEGLYASKFFRIEVDGAKVGCQVFGDCILMTLTLAPMTMEDLPRGLDTYISLEASRFGLTAILIDAHNSINGTFDREKATKLFREACLKAIEEAVEKGREPFEVGASLVKPKEFTFKDGMGPGGIGVLLVKVGDQKVAYVVFDGNNMISGLRERIIEELKVMGIDDGEVMTTDTHVVGARMSTERGYHPVGEVMDWNIILKYVKEAVKKAESSLSPAKVLWRIEEIRGVKVFGSEQIKRLCILCVELMERAKKTFLAAIPTTMFLLILLALFI